MLYYYQVNEVCNHGHTVNFKTYKQSYKSKKFEAMQAILSVPLQGSKGKKKLLQLNEEITKQEEQAENIDRFIGKVRKYLDLNELTPSVLLKGETA